MNEGRGILEEYLMYELTKLYVLLYRRLQIKLIFI